MHMPMARNELLFVFLAGRASVKRTQARARQLLQTEKVCAVCCVLCACVGLDGLPLAAALIYVPGMMSQRAPVGVIKANRGGF